MLPAAPSQWASLAGASETFLQDVAQLLPLHERLRCRAVCRAWRAALSAPAAWQRVEVMVRDADECARELRAAAALAGGALLGLRLSFCASFQPYGREDARDRLMVAATATIRTAP